MVPRGGIEPPTRGFSIFLGSHASLTKGLQSDAKSLWLQCSAIFNPSQGEPDAVTLAHHFGHPKRTQ